MHLSISPKSTSSDQRLATTALFTLESGCYHWVALGSSPRKDRWGPKLSPQHTEAANTGRFSGDAPLATHPCPVWQYHPAGVIPQPHKTADQVREEWRRTMVRKSTGPDGIDAGLLKETAAKGNINIKTSSNMSFVLTAVCLFFVEPKTFAKSFSSGFLIGEVLYKYQMQSDFSMFTKEE